MRHATLASLALGLFAPSLGAQTLDHEFTTAYPGADSGFAEALGLEGKYLVIGSPRITVGPALHAGLVHVYHRVATHWQPLLDLAAPLAVYEHHFGASVSVSGDLVAVGAPGGPTSGLKGSAMVYRRSAGQWAYEAELQPFAAGPGWTSGSLVAADGGTVFVATNPPGGETRLVVFEYQAGTWTEDATLVAPLAGGSFGEAFAIRGDIAVVGAPDELVAGQASAGAVYIFRRTGMGWALEFVLREPTPTAGSRFGASLAFDGSRVLVGVPSAVVHGLADRGRLYVYGQPGSGTWSLADVVDNPDRHGPAGFGARVAIDGGDGLASYGTERVAALRFEAGSWYAEPPFRPDALVPSAVFGTTLELSAGLGVLAGTATGPLPLDLSAFAYELDQPFYLRLDDGQLVAGDPAEYELRGGLPGGPAWLVASLAGPGSFPVPALGTSLDLTAPFLLGATWLDVLGSGAWTIPIPPGTAGLDTWVQGLQFGAATNVWHAVIQP